MVRSDTPTFSVIIPTHNRAHLLPRAIRSVLAQTLPDFELIIVDDGSADETPAIVEELDDPRIRYVRRSNASGVSAARNCGIRQSRGEFVAFLDDDDEYAPCFLEKTHETYGRSDATVAFTWCWVRHVREIEGEATVIREQVWDPAHDHTDAPYIYVGAPGLTVRKQCFDRTGFFDETLNSVNDTDLLIRLSQLFSFAVVPQFLMTCHHHAGARLTDVTQQRVRALEQVVEKNREYLEGNPDLWFEFHGHLAAKHYRLGNKNSGRQIVRKMLRVSPLRSTTWKMLVLLEFPVVEKFWKQLKH